MKGSFAKTDIYFFRHINQTGIFFNYRCYTFVFTGMRAGKLNMTVHSSTSFTIYWEDNLIENYVCYSVEWKKKGHEAAYKSFYQNKNNYRNLSPLPGSQKSFGQPCLETLFT